MLLSTTPHHASQEKYPVISHQFEGKEVRQMIIHHQEKTITTLADSPAPHRPPIETNAIPSRRKMRELIILQNHLVVIRINRLLGAYTQVK